ncbi:MAG TPA: hypothetical protein DCP08_04935 [Chloroflexi bacterium]|nr:hypothetical protein [Chloroflexota bacterium]
MPTRRKKNRAELLEYLAQGRERLLSAIEGLSEEEVTISGVVGDWSVKETLAHIAAWDKETRAVIERAISQEHPKFDYTIRGVRGFAKWNAQEIEKRRAMSTSHILAEMEEAREGLIELTRQLSDEELSRRFVPPWRWPTTPRRNLEIQAEHDIEHADQIMAWQRKRQA